MKKCCLLILCVILLLALVACQPAAIEQLDEGNSYPSGNPTSVPGEPDGVPQNEINGSLVHYFL